jgi:hypothetical protein
MRPPFLIIGGPIFDILSFTFGELFLSSNPLDAVFAELDLADPEDLLVAFHVIRYWPAWPDMDDAENMRQMEVIERYLPWTFGQPDHDVTYSAIFEFLMEMGGTVDRNSHKRSAAPREWLHVFRTAFDREIIGPVALGTAFTYLVIRSTGNGAPGHDAASLSARRVMLEAARKASPHGLMNPSELAKLADLPESLTVWRGGCREPNDMPFSSAQSVHWALDRPYADAHLSIKSVEKVIAMQAAIEAARNDRRGELPSLPIPFLLKAHIPKSCVISYATVGFDGDGRELVIDFDQITPDMIENVTPAEYQWAV